MVELRDSKGKLFGVWDCRNQSIIIRKNKKDVEFKLFNNGTYRVKETKIK